MKKVLFASTALVAAGLMTASGASASEKIKLNLGGYSKWWVVGAWQDDGFSKSNGGGAGTDYANVDVKGDNEIFFGGETKLDNGMTVGVMVELEAGGDVAGNPAGSDRIDKSYAYVETAYGKVIIGSEANGTALLHVMAPDAAGNTDSDGLLTGGFAIQSPGINSKVSTAIDTDGEAEKITYVAPTFYGLTVGGTYIPNAGSEDNRGVVTAGETYGVGALYANTFGGVGVKVSAGFVTYDIAATTENTNEYSAGTQLSYNGFTLGGSYRQIVEDKKGNIMPAGNSVANTNTSNDGRVWDIGLQYASGPWAVSAVYFNSKIQDGIATGQDEFTVYQVSGKYTLGAGVDALATIGHAEYDDETQERAGGDANHNKGWAVMTGLGLTF
ncbi:MAG TPA: porin [Candidatus Omnitrophota bacterium]|nr:porin [Candidatus Omnitrophota bacterium]